MKTSPLVRLSALLALAHAPALAQLPSSELVLRVPQPASPTQPTVSFLDRVTAGADEGWVADCTAALPSGASVPAIVGERLDDDPAGPRFLRLPGTYAGIAQTSVRRSALAGGRVGYVSGVEGSSDHVAWLDDVPLARTGDPFSSAGPLGTVEAVLPLTGGGAIVAGRVALGPVATDLALVAHPGGTILLEHDAPIAGTTETVFRIDAYDVSPSGNHVAAIVRLEPTRRAAVVVDGALYDFDGRAVAIAGEEASALFRPSPPVTSPTFFEFIRVDVTDAGEVVVSAEITGSAAPLRSYVFRRGRRVATPDLEALGVDAAGGILFGGAFFADELDFEDEEVGFHYAGLDTNDDGLAEAAPTVRESWSDPSISGSGRVMVNARLGNTTPFFSQAVLRSTLKRERRTVCTGEANSTGGPTHLDAVGTRWVGYNQMRLVAHGLPETSFALPLVSLDSAPPTPVSGSMGRLCLGGTIGRVRLGSALTSGYDGVASRELALNVLPQGLGFVAAQPGETWYVQLWYRDRIGMAATSNFSDAIAVDLR